MSKIEIYPLDKNLLSKYPSPRSLVRKARKECHSGTRSGVTWGILVATVRSSRSHRRPLAAKSPRKRGSIEIVPDVGDETAVAAAETRRQSSSAAPRRARPWSARTHAQSERANERATYLDHKRDHRLFSFTHARARFGLRQNHVRCMRPLTWIAIHIEYGSYDRAFVSETATSVGDRKHAEHSPLAHVHTLKKPVNNWRDGRMRWRHEASSGGNGRRYPTRQFASRSNGAKFQSCCYARMCIIFT